MKIKFKLINHLTLNGKKEVSEKELGKNFKHLQKKSRKCSSKIFQLALVSSTSVFRLHKISLKKRKKKRVREIPGFLRNQSNRISLALKFLLQSTKPTSGSFHFSDNFSTEILLLSKHKSDSLSVKNDKQKAILAKKHLFRYYRWR